MREDMYKKLVERARPGGHGARKGRAARDLESAPKRQSFRRAAIATGDTKSFSENFAPLRRYLERQINRPWTKVKSEMQATIDVRDPVQAHLFAHLDLMMRIFVTKVTPSASAPCGLMYQDPSHDRGLVPVEIGDLYVDPDDDIIKRARRRTRARLARRSTDPTMIKLGDGRGALQIDGLWCEVHLAHYSLSEIENGFGWSAGAFRVGAHLYAERNDALFGRIRPGDREKLEKATRVYGANRLAHRKRPLSKSELTALSVVNGASRK